MKKVNWKKIGIWFAALFALILFWVLKVDGTSRPIAHVPNILDGKFKVSVGAIREIVIHGEKSDDPVDLVVTIKGEDQKIVWQQHFEDVEITGNRQTLVSFEKENPLVMEQKEYYADLTVEPGTFEPKEFFIVEYNADFKGMYLGLSIVFLAVIALALFLYDNVKIPIHFAYFGLAVMLSMLFRCVMPPLSAGDEYAHFLEAYKLSSKMMRIQFHDQGYILLRADDYDSAVYLHDMASISDWYETFEKGNIDEMVPARELSTVSSEAWYIYLPGAMGITLARLLRLSGHILLLLGGLFNLLVISALFALAVKIAPRGKVFFSCLGLVPEILYFSHSYSYDGINIALCALLVSYFLYLYEMAPKITMKQVMVFGVIFVLMLPIKTVYVWFGLLLVLLPFKKCFISKKVMLGAGTLCGIVCLFLIYMLLPQISYLVTAQGAVSTGLQTSEGVSLSYIMNNPQHLIDCFFNSTFQDVSGFKYTDRYFAAALGQVMASDRYVGRDIYLLPSWMCAAVGFVFLLSLEDARENQLSRFRRYFAAGIGGCIYLSVLLAMYFASTLIIDRKVYGVQGRYFLPIFLLFPLIFKNKFFTLKINVRKWCLLSMVCINLHFIFDTFWHYAYVYFAQPVA